MSSRTRNSIEIFHERNELLARVAELEGTLDAVRRETHRALHSPDAVDATLRRIDVLTSRALALEPAPMHAERKDTPGVRKASPKPDGRRDSRSDRRHA
jgi:hypothetical protein